MAVEYEVAPRKLSKDGSEVLPAEFDDAQFYGVYARGINEHWGVGGKGPDTDKLANHIQDFSTQESAQAFVDRLQANAPQLEALEHWGSVTVAGVRYLPSTDKGVAPRQGLAARQGPDGRATHYVAEGGLADYQRPAVATWEIDRYLKTGELSPELAANAVTDPDNWKALNPFEQQSLKNFAAATQADPSFREFRETETKYARDAGARIPEGVNFRVFIIDDMPNSLQNFVWSQKVGIEQNLNAHPLATQLDAIAHHPAIAQFRQMQSLPHMPERAKAIYADTLFRNHPDLSRRYEQAKSEIQKLHGTDPALMEKIGHVARSLPDLEAGMSDNLVSALQSLSLTPPTQTLRKP